MQESLAQQQLLGVGRHAQPVAGFVFLTRDDLEAPFGVNFDLGVIEVSGAARDLVPRSEILVL